MKNLKKILLLFFLIISTNFSQWIEQESGVTVRLDDVCFVDSLHGWAMSSGGTVIATTDGGKNWQLQLEAFDKPTMTKIKFYDKNLGFVTMYDGMIAKTENGGVDWNYIAVGVPHRLSDVFILTKDSIWITGFWPGGIALLSTDGGENWIKKFETVPIDSISLPNKIKSITFYNSKIGWLLTEKESFDYYPPSSVYNTTDGGENWEFLSNTTVELGGYDSVKISTEFGIFVDPKGILWAWGVDGLIKSNNFGESWIHTEQLPSNSVMDLSYADSNLIYSLNLGGADGNGIYYSEDSGVIWNESLINTGPTLRAISSIGNDKVWVVGNNGTILFNKDVASNIFKENRNKLSFNLSQNYPNPFNPSTTIQYSVPIVKTLRSTSQQVTLKVYDILGREVTTLVNKSQKTGIYKVQFDASNLMSGVYFYRLQSSGFVESKKMILLK